MAQVLDASLEFEGVDADDEYKMNEPADLIDAQQRFDGKWRLTVTFPLGFGFARSEGQISLDRRDFEVDSQHAQFVRPEAVGA